MIYRALCESLETIDRVTDAVACFHQMKNELVQEAEGEQADWILGKWPCMHYGLHLTVFCQTLHHVVVGSWRTLGISS